MMIIPDDIYWVIHLLTYLKEQHSFLLANGIIRQCLGLLYQLPVNDEHVKTITPILRIIGNLVVEETGQVGLELLHEWNTARFIGTKLYASCYKHLHKELKWVVQNILNHPSVIIKKTLKENITI